MTRNMLITRCPDCQTSFRITVDMLHKADGRVRCGRCETVFSAFNSLADSRTDLKALGAEDITLESAPQSKASIARDSTARALDIEEDPGVAADAIVDTELISEREVDHVLATGDDAEPTPPWTQPARVSRARFRRAWLAAAVLACAVLIGQLAHHFRAELMSAPVVGRPLVALYASLGVPIQSTTDPSDYEIVNWAATARTDAQEQATLQISAGIHNRSAETRPLPLLFLKLTDRFDNAIGTRYFEPVEYLGSATGAAVLPPGTTATAHLELVDPGPQAYGFEVDLCVRLERAALRCKADIVYE